MQSDRLPQDPPVLVESDGTTLRFASEIQWLVGGSSSATAGPLRAHVHPDDVGPLDMLETALGRGEPAGAELRLRALGGASRRFSVLVVPTRDHDGHVAGHVAAWRDVDGAIALREELALSERRFRLLAETASDIVYATGADRRITWVSSSIERSFGWSPADLVGTWMSDLVHPDDLAWSAERRDRIYAGDRDAEAEGSFVLRLRTRGGEYRWVSTTLTTHRDADGTPVQFTGGMKVIDDVMEERERLAASEERFRLLAENATDVVYLVRDDAPVWVSPSVTATLGWSVEEWLARGIDAHVHPEDAPIVSDCRAAIAGGARSVVELRLRARDGTYRWVQVNAGPFLDANGHRDGIVASFRTIDEQVAARAELERRATYDDLTGALKREPALRRLEDAARAAGDVPGFAILYVDVDDFKDVNDTRGHAAGDMVLTAVVERIRAVVRRDDAVARIGGDEFLVLLGGVEEHAAADAMADLVRAACATPIETPAGPVAVTCSIGVAVHEPDERPAVTIARADREMYRVKPARRAVDGTS